MDTEEALTEGKNTQIIPEAPASPALRWRKLDRIQ
jgi:hypothetical protein